MCIIHVVAVVAAHFLGLTSMRRTGEAWMVWGDEEKRMPVYALSYNHRAAAFYRADAEDPTNPQVESVRNRGLKRVRILASWTPEFLLRFMSSVRNRYHKGSGASVIEVCKTALMLEASWRASCDHSGMSTNNPGYVKAYEATSFWAFSGIAGRVTMRVGRQGKADRGKHIRWINESINDQ